MIRMPVFHEIIDWPDRRSLPAFRRRFFSVFKRHRRFLFFLLLLAVPCSLSPVPSCAAVWYVNDTSTVGDSYTTAVGNNANAGNSPAVPFRDIPKAVNAAGAGDTIYVDAGLYDSFVTVSSTEIAGINITKDSIALIGKDSKATVIDPPGDSNVTTLYGIYATVRAGLLIKNLGVTGAFYGIYFNNVDMSTISGDSASSCGSIGIYFRNGSDTNMVTSNTASSNSYWGILLQSSSNNTITSNMASSNSSHGISLNSSSNNNTVTSNTASSNSYYGIDLSSSSNNTVMSNTANSNWTGIHLSSSSNNMVTSNTVSSNTSGGIYLNSSSNNTVTSNTANSNSIFGIYLFSSSNITVIQNDSRYNTEYQVYITGTSSSDTVQKNNIVTSATNPDSGVYNGSTDTTAKFTFTRNWWGTTDESVIASKIKPLPLAWRPYRLGIVDTSLTADTTAPKVPSNISITKNTSNQFVLSWTNPTADEENSILTGFGGVRIYRLVNRTDSTDWAAGRVAQVSAPATTWTDTSVSAGNNYYYRLTSFDTWPIINESWFSDSILTTDTGNPAFAFVRRGAANPPPQSVFGAVSDMPVLQIVIGPRANGTLSSLTVTTGGTGNDVTALSASGVKLWQDGDGNGTGDTQLGSSGTVTADNGTVTFSSLSVSLTKDKPLYLVVTYSFAGTATAGQTFYAQIAAASDITATASGGASFNLSGLPITGEPVTAVSSLNTVPSAPTPGSPADNATGVAPNGEVTISGYSDANGDTHKCTHWQVADSTSIFDNMHMRVNVVIPAETAGLRFKFPRGLLRSAQKHYWRARFCDARGGWSAWATTRNFTTATETLAITPTAAKTLDSNPFSRDTRPIGFKLKNGGDEKFTTLGGVKFEEEVSDTGRNQKPSTSFKFGLIAFTCEGVTIGGTITISLNMPESVPTTAKYFIFDAANGWLDMTASLTSHDGDSEVFLTLTDGGTGDLDGVANGVVVDPGGFEISDGSSSSSGDATIKYPAACIFQRIFNLPATLPVFRSVRDRLLDSSWGRKLTNFYYR